MTLKITTVLLSSVLASASYASEGVERSPTEIAVPQQGVIQKAVPDNFEGAGEYRTRRASLESQLKSMEGKKLKEFTPEIFANLCAVGV